MNSKNLHAICALAMLLPVAVFAAEEQPGPRAVMLNPNPQPVRSVELDGDATLVYPATTTSAPFPVLPGTTVTFTWDHGTNAKGYYLRVSTTPNTAGFSDAYTTGTSRTVTGIPCDGSTIYTTLWTDRPGSGLTTTPSTAQFNAPTNCGPDPRAVIASPAPGLSLVGNSATFSWSAVSGALNYTLEVGSTLGGSNFAAGLVNGTSKAVTGLPCDGSTIFARLWTQTSGGNLSPIDFYYKASTTCNLPTQAQLLSPAPLSVLPSQMVDFTWSSALNAQKYWLDVGAVMGQGTFSAGEVFGNSKTSPIGCVNPEVWVRLWTNISGIWQTPLDYKFSSPITCTASAIGRLTTPVPGTTLTGSTITFGWSAGTTALDYWLDIGTGLGQGNIFGGVVAGTSKQVTNIPCTGQTIHARLWTRTSQGYQAPLDYTYTANNGSGSCTNGRAQITSPVPGSVLTTPIQTFTWSAGVGASDYWLDIGTALGQGNISAGVVAATSKQVTVVPCNNVTIYARLWTRIAGAWQAPLDYSYTCNGTDPRAQITAPTPGSTLSLTTQTFAWSAGTGALDYWLDVGTALGQGNISAGVLAATSKQVSNIPCVNTPIFVRLWTRTASGYLAPIDYTYTCNGNDPRAQLTSPAAGTKLPGTTTTFTWTAGTGAQDYWLDVGTIQGSGDISGAVVNGTSKQVSGIPNTGSGPIWVRLWTRIGGVWQTPFDYQFIRPN